MNKLAMQDHDISAMYKPSSHCPSTKANTIAMDVMMKTWLSDHSE
nr:hypothetical protein [Ochrobactrum sp. CM-21-5]